MDYIALSKEVSYALRHAPWKYELEMDESGFVKITQLLSALNEGGRYEREITQTDLDYIIENSEKKRFELSGGKIRAAYGHSFKMKIKYEAATPPDVLYHGTARRFLEPIMSKGLKLMSRQYVHLSADVETAVQVGKRRDETPAILEIDAKSAAENGIIFYHANEKVWLCDSVPAEYIKLSQHSFPN